MWKFRNAYELKQNLTMDDDFHRGMDKFLDFVINDTNCKEEEIELRNQEVTALRCAAAPH